MPRYQLSVELCPQEVSLSISLGGLKTFYFRNWNSSRSQPKVFNTFFGAWDHVGKVLWCKIGVQSWNIVLKVTHSNHRYSFWKTVALRDLSIEFGFTDVQLSCYSQSTIDCCCTYVQTKPFNEITFRLQASALLGGLKTMFKITWNFF